MTDEKPPVQIEDKVDECVTAWINENPAEFTIDGNKVDLKPENEHKLRFRLRILERCKQYKNAPDEYLTTYLKAHSENVKWYFSILQAILMTGVVGFFVTVSVLAITNFISWFQNINLTGSITWILPVCFSGLIIALGLRENKRTNSSWLSHIIQYRFRIIHNLTELKIEIYYIATIMKIRKEKTEGNNQNSELKEPIRVEVYGSLLNSGQREKNPLKKGMMTELGKQERIGWKLSFDKRSVNRDGEFYNEAVLNFVWTGNQKDVYYTTVYQVDTAGYDAVMKREMGENTAKKWKQGEAVKDSYRPFILASDFGDTVVFIIPCDERQLTPSNRQTKYYKTVKEGIEENYEYSPNMKAKNLEAFEKAVDESQTAKAKNAMQ